jgi:GxxExxY protein
MLWCRYQNHGDTMTQSNTEKNFEPLTEHERMLTQKIVDIAFSIHKSLGPGLLESIYQKCFCYELSNRSIPFETQKGVSIYYNNLKLDDALRIDILVDNSIIVELKAQENYHPVWEAQLLSYLKLTNIRLGYILNFHVPLMKNGIKRMIL